MSKSLMIGAVKRVAPTVSAEVASAIVISILDTVADELVSQGTFRLHQIGALRLIEKPAKQGRNPATGESILIAPKLTIRYRLSTVLAERLNQKSAEQRATGADKA